MAHPITAYVEPAPDPDSMRLTPNRTAARGKRQTHRGVADAAHPPLAHKLLAIPGVKTRLSLNDAVTVGREERVDWEDIPPGVERAIRAFDQDV